MSNAGYSLHYFRRGKSDEIFGFPAYLLKIRITCPKCGVGNITEDHPVVTDNLSCFKCGHSLAGELLCEILWNSLPKSIGR